MKACVGVFLGIGISLFAGSLSARDIALTFDDGPTADSAMMTGVERSQRILKQLQAAKVPDAWFFIKADGINAQTQPRLAAIQQAGYHLANHSYSHQAAGELGAKAYMEDVYKAHLILRQYPNFVKYHRFPFLNYGKDLPEINQLQALLTELGYQNGYITVDDYDWYISSLLDQAYADNKSIDYQKARDFYVSKTYEAVEFYDALAQKVLGRSPKHVLLLHEYDSSALFIGDLIKHLRQNGWNIISPQEAYSDPIAQEFPQVNFHGQGRVAALAFAKGIPAEACRSRVESQEYLQAEFERAGIVQDSASAATHTNNSAPLF